MVPNQEKFMYKNKLMKKLTAKYFIVLASLAFIMFANLNLVTQTAQAATLPFVAQNKLERHCKVELPKFPFAFNPKTGEFFKYNGSNRNASEDANPINVIKTSNSLKKLLEGCRCKDFITTRGIFGVETEDIKRSSWATFHLKNVCQYIQEQRLIETEGASGTTSIEYCTIESTKLVIKDLKITLPTFKRIDQTKDCVINSDGREKCLSLQHYIKEECKTGHGPESKVEGIECKNKDIVQCVGNSDTPIIFDFNDGFTSESLNINKVLKTEDQKGFQNITDQGAGTNNPAINILLYIINTLANLSFLISVFMLIMAGFYTVIASGNTEMNNKAKAAIKYFVMAVSFTLLSYSIVTIIKALLYS